MTSRDAPQHDAAQSTVPSTAQPATLPNVARPLRVSYPFTALVAQDALQQALLLAAIDPGLGGVLISGPRGTAKSTTARALADLLPEGRFVTLPLGAAEAQLIGTLDLDAVLKDGQARFAPGLLAKAHQGVLYVDEVNLLPDSLVDPLLDVASSGVNVVERDGVSHAHDACFVLIGTMNPEEGELRPQLSDRFGLAVTLANCIDPALRQEIVKTRLAFDADPEGFYQRHAARQSALATRLKDARQRLATLVFDDAVHACVSRLCIEAGVDGMRADLVMLKAARALAAFEAADDITVAHVNRVAEGVLMHRRRHGQNGAEAHPSSNPTPDGASGASSAAAGAPGSESTSSTARPHGLEGGSQSLASQAHAVPQALAGGEDAGIARDNGDGGGMGGAGEQAEQDHRAAERARGYLRPEPVATLAVKRLRPLPLKKV
jgi:magnesium chelatase subunit I